MQRRGRVTCMRAVLNERMPSCHKNRAMDMKASIDMERLMEEAELKNEVRDKIRSIASNTCGTSVEFHFLERLGPKGAQALSLALQIPKDRPTLRSLTLNNNQICHGVTTLAEGLKSMPSLRTLKISNTGIGNYGLGPLAEAVGCLKNLEVLWLDGNQLRDEHAVVIARALRHTPSLVWLRLSNNSFGHMRAEDTASILDGVPKLTRLELKQNQIQAGGACALARKLEHATTLRWLELEDNQIADEGAFAFAKLLATTPSLESLRIHNNSLTTRGVVRFFNHLRANPTTCAVKLFEHGLSDSSDVAIALATLRYFRPEVSVAFTEAPGLDNSGFAPVAEQAYQKRKDQLELLETGLVKLNSAKVFVCGDYGVGKTTMVSSLPGILRTVSFYRRVRPPPVDSENPAMRTAGVEVSELSLRTWRSKTPASLRIYDFGGQPAYHVVHTLLVSDHNAAFVVCVDLSKPEEAVKKSLWYWLRFICTRLTQGSRTATAAAALSAGDAADAEGDVDERPHVFLVGTKADDAHNENRTQDGKIFWADRCIAELQKVFGPTMSIEEPFLALNCRLGNATGFGALRDMLVGHWQQLEQKQLLVPRVVDQVKKILEEARKTNKGPWDVKELTHFVRAAAPWLDDVPNFDEITFPHTLEYLHLQGDVLWFSDSPTLSAFVFISPNFLLNVIMGRALAPNGVQCGGLDPRDGVVSYHDIAAAFNMHALSADLVIEVLRYSHLCFELPLQRNGKRQFVLPSRLENEATVHTLWPQERGWSLYAGKRLLVEDDALALPAGFLARVQTSLHSWFGDTLRLWRNAFKLTTAGVQCVGIIRNDREMDVWIRAKTGASSNARACLLQVFSVIENEAEDIKFAVHAISPSQLSQSYWHPASYVLDTLLGKDPSKFVTSTYHDRGRATTETVGALLLLNQTPTEDVREISWHADDHEWWHHHWRLDKDFDQRLEWTGPGQGNVYTASLPRDSGLYQWIASEVNTGHGVTLSRVEVVKSPTTLGAFKFRVQQTAERLRDADPRNPFNQDAWKSKLGKAEMVKHLTRRFAHTEARHVNVIPLWHGCPEAAVEKITSSGAAYLGSRDKGVFGAGIYFAQEAAYAAGYSANLFEAVPAPANGDGEHVLLLCAVSIGLAYPITRQDDYKIKNRRTWCRFVGRPLKTGCDAHYIQVTAASDFHATEEPGTFDLEEVVVSQEAQVLPFAKVYVRIHNRELGDYLAHSLASPVPCRFYSTAAVPE